MKGHRMGSNKSPYVIWSFSWEVSPEERKIIIIIIKNCSRISAVYARPRKRRRRARRVPRVSISDENLRRRENPSTAPRAVCMSVGMRSRSSDDYTTGADRYYYYSKVSFCLSIVFRTGHGPDEELCASLKKKLLLNPTAHLPCGCASSHVRRYPHIIYRVFQMVCNTNGGSVVIRESHSFRRTRFGRPYNIIPANTIIYMW